VNIDSLREIGEKGIGCVNYGGGKKGGRGGEWGEGIMRRLRQEAAYQRECRGEIGGWRKEGGGGRNVWTSSDRGGRRPATLPVSENWGGRGKERAEDLEKSKTEPQMV